MKTIKSKLLDHTGSIGTFTLLPLTHTARATPSPPKKESEMAQTNCVSVEEDEAIDNACQFVEEEINGIPVVFIATEEADLEEK